VGEAMIVAGIGCKGGASTDAVLGAISAALNSYAVNAAQLDALATSERKAAEPGIRGAAHTLALAVHALDDDALRATQHLTLTHSSFSMAVAGVSSLSEAAALAASGPGSRLLGPRIARNGVTCALATDGVIP
jgi:cobalt-precorrin 5A hydrolase